MNDITIDISNLNFKDPEIAGKIQDAVENGQPFALYRKDHYVVFNPEHMVSISKSKGMYTVARFNYLGMHEFTQAIQLQLVTHRVFIPLPRTAMVSYLDKLIENKS